MWKEELRKKAKKPLYFSMLDNIFSPLLFEKK